FDTGRNSEAVLANQTVARANGSGERPTCRARKTMTGGMSTAVVSKDMNAVLTVTMARTNTHSSARRPRPQTARRPATMEHTPATLASSAPIVMAMTKTRTGPLASASSARSSPGRRPVTIVRTATAMSSHGTMTFHRTEAGFHWLARTPAEYGTPCDAEESDGPRHPRNSGRRFTVALSQHY